jgi:hypothetical protein
MSRTPEDRERFRRVLEENAAAREEMQAIIDRVRARRLERRVRRERGGWLRRLSA